MHYEGIGFGDMKAYASVMTPFLSQPKHAFQRIIKSESIMHFGNVAVSEKLPVPW